MAPRPGGEVFDLLARHRQSIRIFLAGFSATRETLDQAERSTWAAWAAQQVSLSVQGDIEARAALLQAARTAITHQLDALAQEAIANRDPLLHLLAQRGRELLQAHAGSNDDSLAQIRAKIDVLAAEDRALLHAKYLDRLPNSVIARSRGWSTGRVDAQLMLAREALNGPHIDSSGDGKEGIVPTLIEDYLSRSMDAPSRALLAEKIMTDLTVAARFEHQVRLDLVLTEVFSPQSSQDFQNFVDQLKPGTASPSGASPVRPAISSRHRTSSEAGDLRKSPHAPVRRSQSRSQSVTWSIVGVVAAILAVTCLIVATVSRSPAAPMPHPAVRLEAGTPAPHVLPPAHDASPLPHPPPSDPQLAHQPQAESAAASQAAGPRPASPPPPERSADPIPAPPPELSSNTPSPALAAVPPPATVAPLTSSAPAAGGAAAARSTFVTGIHFGGEAVTIDGHRWLSEKQAIEAGMSIRNGRRTLSTVDPLPAVDAETRAMLTTGVAAARNEPLAITLKLPNGGYEAYVYLMENLRANSRLLDVEVGGETVPAIGDLPLGGWSKYGPCSVMIKDGTLEIIAKARKGTPVLMGLTLFRTLAAKTYLADFSDGTAKDWTPSGGTWSCADGHYLHTSNQGVEVSFYGGATWSDFHYSASMFPHFDNAYGLIIDAQDAQEYIAISIVATTATLFHMAHGVKTQIAESPCTGTGQWKWSTIDINQSGSSVSVSINNAPVFTKVAIGEPQSGKIGLFTDWNPVDFAKISVTAAVK